MHYSTFMTTPDFSPMLYGKSPGRCFLNASVAEVTVEPPIVDVAGGWSFSYHNFLDTNRENTTILNLPREESATIAADAESNFPLKDDCFETALCFNALEHLYHYDVTLEEISRVVAPGGRCLVCVPFLNGIHGDPNDYQRLSPQRLRKDLENAGFTDIEISTLDPGPLSAAVSIIRPLFKLDLLKYLSWQVACRLDRLVHQVNNVLQDKHPIAIFVDATVE